MKILKCTLLSILVCVVCTNQALCQVPQVACGVAAYFHDTNTLAIQAHEGDVLDYVVQVTNGPFPINNGVVTLKLPDLTVVTLDNSLSLPALGSKQYPVAFPPVPANQRYTIDANDIGNNSAPAGSVQALSSCVADANIGGGSTVQVTGTGQWPTAVKTPCVEVTKTVEPTVSKVGDEVLYTIEIHNCGNVTIDVVSIIDTILGSLSHATCDTLIVGETCTIEDVNYVIQPGDPDPLINVVEVNYVDRIGPPAFRQNVTDDDDAQVDLLDPNFEVIKDCPPYSKIGDTVANTITITNTSADTNLIILSVVDSLKGELEGCDGLLEIGDPPCVINYDYNVPADANDPLVNEVNVVAQVQGLSNILNEIATCETDLVEPNFTVTKTCVTEPVVGNTATFHIRIENTGDVNLVIDTNEPELPGPVDLVVGQVIELDVNRPVDPNASEVCNEIEVTATLPEDINLPNTITKKSPACCTVPGLQGCTPGFWKNHTDCWDCYSTGATLESVFDVPNSLGLDNRTLLQALAFKGGNNTVGAARILLRAAVSALLNSCNPDIDYPLTTADVIAQVNTALATLNRTQILALATTLDEFNNLGCGINAHCDPIDD